MSGPTEFETEMQVIFTKSAVTLYGVPLFVMFCFVLFQKIGLPIGLHSSCRISPTAGGTCQQYWDAPHCTKMIFREYDPGVLAAEAKGSGGQDGGDEECDEDEAHGRSAVLSDQNTQEI